MVTLFVDETTLHFRHDSGKKVLGFASDVDEEMSTKKTMPIIKTRKLLSTVFRSIMYWNTQNKQLCQNNNSSKSDITYLNIN